MLNTLQKKTKKKEHNIVMYERNAFIICVRLGSLNSLLVHFIVKSMRRTGATRLYIFSFINFVKVHTQLS